MFEHKKIQNLDDFFIDFNGRQNQGVYFYRINGFNEKVGQFITKYYEAARLSGAVIEGRIPNPDEKNLSYYNEMMGMEFRMDLGFITSSLQKWLPRMNDRQRSQVASSIYDCLVSLHNQGKNENMLRNAYIKFMCWLYYKFESVVNKLGDNKIPKILYEGDISNYELMLISILSNAGCDVVLLQYHGDAGYLKLDKESKLSDNLVMEIPMEAFPKEFNLAGIRSEIQKSVQRERLYGARPEVSNCTNAWIKGEGLEDVRTSLLNRGNDSRFFYNCFLRINGVEDKLTYLNELFQFQLELRNSGRQVVIVDGEISQPTMDEIAEIQRKNYQKQEQMLMDLSTNIRYVSNQLLQRILIRAFIDTMLEEENILGMTLNRLTNKAVYLLCWVKRYLPMLFSGWKMPDIGCFIHMGACKNENEALFLRFLAKIPVDVVILSPNLDEKCCLNDGNLFEKNYPTSMVVKQYPQSNGQIQMGTMAYHAERELDTLMYQDSGVYRNQQYQKANAVTLQTMYEEISILWNTEMKYRPNFSTVDDVVNMPVIFAKVSGVKDGQQQHYWSSIKQLLNEDAVLISNAPYLRSTDANPMKAYVPEFFKNGKVQKTKIREHHAYQYGFLREEMQLHMLDKLQILIDQRLIRGTFENGTEYTIVATALNLKKDILRMIQKFDFTKKNPKLIYINTGENPISLEDSIVAAFLNLIGFDVMFFVPTGYQCVERHFNKRLMEEHQIGEYLYDLQVPNFERIPSNTRPSWRDKIFKRGT